VGELYGNLAKGFAGVVTPAHLMAVFAGSFMGTVVGVLPGLGPSATIAILLPMTLTMGPTTGLIMLAGIFFGAQYGGSTTSILFRMPGEASSVITSIDGHEMAKKGRAGAALTASAIGSFLAANMGFIGLALFAVPLARYALRFGPPEYFALSFGGLLILANVSGGSRLRNLAMVGVGVMLGTVGTDPIAGALRLDFGVSFLAKGIDYTAVLIGLFGMAEIIAWAIAGDGGVPRMTAIRVRDLYPTREEWRRMVAPIFRGGVVGFLVGLLPGPGAITSTYVSYAMERGVSKRRDEFGRGAIEGVAGPESANNAAAVGQMVPLLALGLPFSGLTAMLLGAMMMQGITPGPLFIAQRPDVFWVLVASFFLGNLVLLVFNLPLVGLMAMVLRVPMTILMAIIALLCILGTFSLNSDFVDVWMMLVFGVIGFVMQQFHYEPPPLILGMVFGPIMERALVQSLLQFQGDLLAFWARPISAVILSAAIAVAVAAPLWAWRSRRAGRNVAGVVQG